MDTPNVIASDCKERGNLENNKFHSIFCYFFLDCHVGTMSLLAMTVFFYKDVEPCNNATTKRKNHSFIANRELSLKNFT
ncbi:MULTISPECIES: hypothetical protein [unclassified Rickettsia]|uniref:hypothetical protein n=1 Tax=unclassified Rickettsia TaxID=114295 RepID=UPI003132E071